MKITKKHLKQAIADWHTLAAVGGCSDEPCSDDEYSDGAVRYLWERLKQAKRKESA